MKYLSTRQYVLIISAVLLIASVALLILNQAIGDNRWYDCLEIGMHRSLVLERVESKVDLEYKFKSFTILYVPSSSRFMRRINPSSSDPFPSRCMQPHNYEDIGYSGPGSVVNSLNELPDLYGYFQMAFDENELLCAYTLIGESYSVTFTGGTVRGSHLSKLPELLSVQGDEENAD